MIARIGTHQIDVERIDPQLCFLLVRSMTSIPELLQSWFDLLLKPTCRILLPPTRQRNTPKRG